MLHSFIKYVVLTAFMSLAVASPTNERRGITPAAAGVANPGSTPRNVNTNPAGTKGLKLTKAYMVGEVTVQVFVPDGSAAKRSLDKRATIDITGDNCDSACFAGNTGGPNQADCGVIANTFGGSTSLETAGPGGAVFLYYKSCQYVFRNKGTKDTYQYQDNYVVSIGNYLAGACNGGHGAHGGYCLFRDYPATVECSHT